jgi:hypothetical protein
MEPALDPIEVELQPGRIVGFAEDLSKWANIPPEYVGPPESRTKHKQMKSKRLVRPRASNSKNGRARAKRSKKTV